MSIVFVKSWDDGFVDDGIDASSGTVTLTTSTAAVRGVHTRSLRVGASATSTLRFDYTMPTAMASGWIYTAFRFDAIGARIILTLMDNATVHLTVNLRADGKFDLTRNGTVLATSTFASTADTWVQMAIQFTIADSPNGVGRIRFNGDTTSDIDFTGDTRNAANAQITLVRYGAYTGNSTSMYVSELVVQDSAGSAPENDWLGDIEAIAVFPNGAGDAADWTVGGTTPAATDWESVDEVPPDDATTTLDSNVVNDQELMTYSDLAVTGGTIFAVCPQVRAQKTSAGARELALLAKLSGTTATGANKVLATSWTRYMEIMHDDPGGSAWTGANANSAQYGFELTV